MDPEARGHDQVARRLPRADQDRRVACDWDALVASINIEPQTDSRDLPTYPRQTRTLDSHASQPPETRNAGGANAASYCHQPTRRLLGRV
jgi:hypothetical protein